MSSANLLARGNPPLSTFLDGSLRARTGEFSLLIALRSAGAEPAAVTVTLECDSGGEPPRYWEFPVRLYGLTVMVGEADAAEGEAPLLRDRNGGPACPAEIDTLFTRSFRLFSVINQERLTLMAVGMTPIGIPSKRA